MPRQPEGEPRIVPGEFFVLRTPLLAFDEFTSWGLGLGASAARDVASLDEAIEEDRSLLRERLRQIYRRPEVREAVFVASPDLAQALEAWSESPPSAETRRAELALIRYWARMTGRSTPFGIFAGFSVGVVGDRTEFRLEDKTRYQRRTRLDNDYLYALVAHLDRPDRSGRRLYRPNSSLYGAAGRLRYAESLVRGKDRAYRLVSIERSDPVRIVLERASGDGATLPDLSAALLDRVPEVSETEAEDFVVELIENQVLISDLAPSVTGAEPLAQLIRTLERSDPEARKTIFRLMETEGALEALDQRGVGNDRESYEAIAGKLEELPLPVEMSRLFQVDLSKPGVSLTLGGDVIKEVIAAIQVLRQVTLATQHDRPIVEFRRDFLARYENREVPLVEALDDEIGVGFDSSARTFFDAVPQFSDLDLFSSPPETSVPWSSKHNVLLNRVTSALAEGKAEINLTPAEVGQLASEAADPLPAAFVAFVSLAADSEERISTGDYKILLRSVEGPSGAQLLGRFCHADERLRRFVEGHLRSEEGEDPEALYAEIVHLPADRMGNILCRPTLRSHEIPYLGKPSVDSDAQIGIEDLLVSINDGKITLRSKSLGREVVPRLTSAHNFGLSSLPVYRFLCALQVQRGLTPMWNWGALAPCSFLPRVSVGRVVLTKARWNVSGEELGKLVEGKPSERFENLQAWRQRRRIPRYAVYAEFDNQLPVDFENVLSVDAFLAVAQKHEAIVLLEMFPGAEDLLVSGPEGKFFHEIVLPFHLDHSQEEASPQVQIYRRESTVNEPTPTTLRRTFPPGTEWLYAKLYTGNSSGDRVLSEVVAPLREEALANRWADRWFFLRFDDPKFHLRLRVQGPPERLWSEVLPRLRERCESLFADGRLWKIQLETYEREVERYGGVETIELAERVFCHDSEAALAISTSLMGDQWNEARWFLTLLGMDRLFEDFGFDTESKYLLASQARGYYLKEFRVEKAGRILLGDRFRKDRRRVESLFVPRSEMEKNEIWTWGSSIFDRRSEELAGLCERFRELAARERTVVSLKDLALSFVHIHVNRMLRSAQRPQELILYDYLVRVYRSQLARQGRKVNVERLLASSNSI